MAVCTGALEPSAGPFAGGAAMVFGGAEGVLGEPIEHIEHCYYANTAGYTERDRLNHFPPPRRYTRALWSLEAG